MSEIRNREQIQQIKDFSGLKWGKIYPTDIDGFFEINNKIFVFIELKYGGRELKGGQKLALERLVDVIAKEKEAILIIARYDEELEKDINVATCKVIKYRYRKRWIHTEREWTVKECCDWFIG